MRSSAPKRKHRQSVLIIFLSLFSIARLRQDTTMNLSKYRHALGVVHENPRFGALNSSDKNNDVVVVVVDGAPAAATGNHNSSTSTTFRLPSSEWIDDIDTDTVLGCGGFKCAFLSRTTKRGDVDNNRSSSSNSPDPDRGRYGYLVAGSGHYKNAERTFALAQKLSVQFSVKHTLAANPIQLSSSSHNFVVQPIKLYSEGSYLFKCKQKYLGRKPLRVHSALVDPILFQERLRYDYKKTMRMMTSNSTHSKCLAQDFQLVIDAITGSILHIDLDRCWQEFGLNLKRHTIDVADCMQTLESIIERLIDRKNYVYYNSTTTIDDDDDDDDDHKNTTKKSKAKHIGKVIMIKKYKRERERNDVANDEEDEEDYEYEEEEDYEFNVDAEEKEEDGDYDYKQTESPTSDTTSETTEDDTSDATEEDTKWRERVGRKGKNEGGRATGR